MKHSGVWVLSRDLMFSSRISGLAREWGLPCQMLSVWSLEGLTVASTVPAGLIVDLDCPQLQLDSMVQQCHAHGVKVIACGPHVHKDLLAAATAAGCDEVYPRSRFVAQLPSILQQWIDPPEGAPQPGNHET